MSEAPPAPSSDDVESVITVGWSTDVGGHRDLNEDAVLVAWPVFAVADGMGGHAAGEIASALAVAALSQLRGRADLRPDDVVDAITAANAAILAHERDAAETVGMGTTITGLCLGLVGATSHWFVFNVGDSRVYRFADGYLRQLTVDHSEVAELVAAGQITAEQALRHPQRNVVTRSLGSDPAPLADVWVLPVAPGERFLVCSDGLPLELPEPVIAGHLAMPVPAQTVAESLVLRAVSAGGRDNVSVVVVDVTASHQADRVDESTSPRGRELA